MNSIRKCWSRRIWRTNHLGLVTQEARFALAKLRSEKLVNHASKPYFDWGCFKN